MKAMDGSGKVRLFLCLVAATLVLGAAGLAAAQASAVVTAVSGRVEVQAKGETAWQPLRAGMAVLEGAGVRAHAGGGAELRLPDGSTLAVAENTRFVVTQLDFDQQNRMRSAFFHLAAGKLRGIVAKAAVALVQGRQGNFAVTTPTAVAAVRGTTIYATFNPATNETTFLVTGGIAVIRDMATGQLVTIDARTTPQVSTVSPGAAPSPPVPATPAQVNQAASTAQPATPGTPAVLNAPTVITVPADVVVVQMIQAAPPAAGAPPPPVIVVTPAPAPPQARDASPIR
jgi:hypothetical protein